MSHVGRPYDKQTGKITISELEAVDPIVDYLDQKLALKGLIPALTAGDSYGITDLSPMAEAVAKLKKGDCDYIYLPNTRWFKAKKPKTIVQIALRNIGWVCRYIHRDAFGSWQPHASTYHITKCLPSCTGLLMLRLSSLNKVFEPKAPLWQWLPAANLIPRLGHFPPLLR